MPGSIRLYLDQPLRAGESVALPPGQAHYLGRVMRRAVGDAVVLFNGRDGEWSARIAVLERDRARAEPQARLRPQRPEPDVWLLAAPLRRDLTELVVEKATELGAARIRMVATARTQPGRINAARLRAIAIEAAEQCERLTVPEVEEPQPLASVLSAWPAGRLLAVAAERRAAPAMPAPAGPAALLVGPEGGFAPAELDGLLRTSFVVPVSLGPRILRAETAAIAGLALLQARMPPAPEETEA